MLKDDNYFMNLALKEALKAYEKEEVPIGCILVDENKKIVAKSYNKREILNAITGHAELLCLKKASKKLNNWRLNNLTMYVTLEPCIMCASAISQSRIKRLVFGAYENNTGGGTSLTNVFKLENSKCEVIGGVKELECKELIKKFFKERRK